MMKNKSFIESGLARIQLILASMQKDKNLLNSLHQAIEVLCACLENKKKIMLAGNGGSAAHAQHMSAEFVSRFMFNRPGLPSLSLTTDTSALTAIGNDYGFEYIYSRQIQALGREGDVFIACSTSGNSPNILKALQEASLNKIKTIGMTGSKGKKMVDLCDIAIEIPSDSTPLIQEGHLIVGHILCDAVEQRIFKKN